MEPKLIGIVDGRMDGPLGAIDGLNGETSDCEAEGRTVGQDVVNDGIAVGSQVAITVG